MEIRERLVKKSWIVDDILEHDDGSVREIVEAEGSFLWLMIKGAKDALKGRS